MIYPASSLGPPDVETGRKEVQITQVAKDLETTFLSEMLKAAGFGKQPESFNGGIGEEQFSSFLVRAQAEAMVEAGGLGLTEVFARTMMEAENERS